MIGVSTSAYGNMAAGETTNVFNWPTTACAWANNAPNINGIEYGYSYSYT